MRRGVFALIGILLLASLAQAQSFKATLVGQITDPSGATVPGAAVTVIEESTGRVQSAKTNEEGNFTIPELPPGRYKLTVEAPGFRTITQTGLVLETDQTRRVNLTLQLGAPTETVTVQAEVPVVATDTSSKGEVITQTQVQDLPLNGRNFTDLALLVPGVYRRPADDDQGEGLATAGTRTDATNFILDGVVNRSDRNASVGVNTSVDSIREFNVFTSTYSAEYGRTAGGQINVVSKSGTNRLHGTAFEYLRNNVFDANNFFTAPGEDKKLRRNQFGGTLGGRIVRDRTFYFGSYEGTRERRSQSSLNTAPSAEWMKGDFRNVRGSGKDGVPGNSDDTNRIQDPFTKKEFPTPNVIPESMFHSISKQILPFLPASNLPGALDAYAASGLNRVTRNQLLAKLDHRFSGANSAYVRWARQSSNGYDPFPSDRNYYPRFGRDTLRRYDSLSASDTHVFSPRFINEFRFGLYDQHNENLGENRQTDFNAKFGIPGLTTDPKLQGFPAIRIDGYSEFGDRPNDPFIYSMKNHQFLDAASLVLGNHSFKVGADVIRSHYSEADVRNVRGDFRFRGRNTNPAGSASSGFRSFADFLLGLPDQTQRQIGADPANLTGWQYAFFLQDDWKVSSRLTVNLGLRYELQTPLSEASGRIANFIPWLGEVVRSGDKRFPGSLVETDKNNFGPRLGFAYRPFNDNRTVIRAAGGIYFSMESFNPIRQQLAVTYPFIQREQYSRVSSNPGLLTFSNPFPESQRGIQGIDTPFGLQVDYHTPEFYQYNFTLERELVPDLALEVGYVGSLGRFLGRRYNLNQPDPVGLNPTGTVRTVRPYPQFGDIQYQEQTATSSYNALQTSLRRRTKSGLTLLASYTFSRSIDTASSTNNSTTGTQKFPQDVRNFKAERGLSDFHRAHQFMGSFNYELPFGRGRAFLRDMGGAAQALFGGWQLNGIVSLLSGRPFTPQYSAADVSQQRPDLAGDPYAGIPPGLFFNPAAFARPVATAAEPNLFGNAGRNILIGPGFHNVDLSLHKNFQISEGLRLQFRAEAFNAFNHPNFQVPVFQLDRSNVGQFTQTANEGREFQFALKFIF